MCRQFPVCTQFPNVQTVPSVHTVPSVWQLNCRHLGSIKKSPSADCRTFETSFVTRSFGCIVGRVRLDSGRSVTPRRSDIVQSRSMSLVNWLKYGLCASQWGLVCGRAVLVAVAQYFYLAGILVGGVLCAQLLTRSVSLLCNSAERQEQGPTARFPLAGSAHGGCCSQPWWCRPS